MKKSELFPEYFNLKTEGKLWIIRCKLCSSGWSLPKNNKHTGNLLHLLNHAMGHKENSGND